ncbi:PDZ domain-containing protein [Thermoactinomyces sp. DSM 45891]|uniref:PDZ domain-containing protein n=1 Tax=Thermoactinomyces sp. DSM 45891 TaxID=1761907 RepID=UPI0009115AE8|nr:PDZ domain-containing protein [Thermoactinomyces sp. DSM 45891]SFX22598.1 PDZ domain-containing protein [Thermoactinomyces sp. DSM 45891]
MDWSVWLQYGMDVLQSVGDVGLVWLQMWEQPWWLIAFLLPFIHVFSLVWREYRLYGRTIESPIRLLLRTCLIGIGWGFVASLAWTSFSFDITAQQIVYVWCVCFAVSLLRFRFAGFSYAVGLLSVISLVLAANPEFRLAAEYELWLEPIRTFAVLDWIMIVASAQLIEWVLIRLEGNRGMLPVEIKQNHGQVVSGYLLSRVWTLFSMIQTSSGWLPLPISLSFASNNCTKSLARQQRLTSTYVLMLSALLFVSSWISLQWQPFIWIASILTLVGHECIYLIEKYREKRKEPVFVSDERGVKVLAVVPETPAAEMGIRPGYTIQKVNGICVNTMDDMESALATSAYSKFELLDERNDFQILHTAIYEDTPKHLGMIGAIPASVKMGQEMRWLDMKWKSR